MARTRDYRNPRTELGVPLASPSEFGGNWFALHECGCLAYEDWNHRGIQSPYWRLHHNRESGNGIRFGERFFPLSPDEVLLIPRDITFDTVGRNTAHHTWIHFSLANEFLITLQEPLPLPLGEILAGLYRSLFDAAHEAGGSASPAGEKRVLHHLAGAILHTVFAQLPDRLLLRYPEKLQSLLHFIREAPDADLTNPALASRCGMGLDSFLGWFKKLVGTTPARYVSQSRIRVACERLSLTDETIEEVADATGFPNRYYFTRVFRKQMGCAPATFRRNQTAH